MIPAFRISVWKGDMSSCLLRDVAYTDCAGGHVTYEDTPGGCGAAQIGLGLRYEDIAAKGYWTAPNIVEISTVDDQLLQAVTVNLTTTPNSLGTWAITNGARAAGGPGGAGDFEATGTGSPQTNTYCASNTITVVPGTAYSFSAWIDPSQIVSGGAQLGIYDPTLGVTQYANASFPSGAAGRFAINGWIAPAGVTQVKAVFQVNGATITSGQKLKWSQPLFEAMSTASARYVSSVSGGSTMQLYVGSTLPYDTAQGEDAQQIYLDDGVLTMGLTVTAVGVDTVSGSSFITVNPATISMPGNPASVTTHAYGAGTFVGRRRYAGVIRLRERPNQKMPKATILCGPISDALTEAYGGYTIGAAGSVDVTTAILAIMLRADFQSNNWPHLVINAANFATLTGSTFSGNRSNASAADMINDMIKAISSGDLWFVRVGHDRAPRLIKLYTSSTNTYTYNVTLAQGSTTFEPLNVNFSDQNISTYYNRILVMGNTNPATQQPYSAIVTDATAVTLAGRYVDGAPQTNTALTADLACATYARSLLNQFSIGRSQITGRVHTRNDITPDQAPQGLANGDVIRGVQCVTVTRFDGTGSVVNLVPDSPIQYGTGLGAKWFTNLNAMTVNTTLGPNGSNAWISNGTGSAVNADEISAAIDIVPGQTYSLSGWINPQFVTVGSPQWQVWTADMATQIGTISWTAGAAASTKSVPVPIPATATYKQVRVVANTNGCTQAAGFGVLFSQPQFQLGGATAYVANNAAPDVFGLVSSVVSTVDVNVGERYQDFTAAAVEPDWTAVMDEADNAVASSLHANTPTTGSISSYCVSSGAFPPTFSTASLVVGTPAFLALFAQGSAVVAIGASASAFTLPASTTSWVWRTAGGGWTIQQVPTSVAGAIPYGYFTTSATGVLGFTALASIGVMQVGVGNINFGNHPAPTYTAGSSGAVNSPSPTSLSSQVTATVALTNANADATVCGVVFYYRVHDVGGGTPGPWLPLLGEPVSPTAGNNQTISLTFEAANGQTIDVTCGYAGIGENDFGPLAAAPIKSSLVVNPIVVTTPYLSNGGIVNPPNVTQTGVTAIFTPVGSTNGISGSMRIRFTVTNHPTDGSCKKLALYRRVTGSGAAYERLYAVVATNSPSGTPVASGVYDMTPADLTNGQQYDWGCAFENAAGGDSPQGFADAAHGLIGASPAATVIIGTVSFAAMPAGIQSTGPNINSPALTVASTAGSNTVLNVTAGTGTLYKVGYNYTLYDGGSTEVVNVTATAANTVTVARTAFSHTIGVLFPICGYGAVTTPGAGVTMLPWHLMVPAVDYGGAYGAVPNWLDDLVAVMRLTATGAIISDSEVIPPTTTGVYTGTFAIPAGATVIDGGFFYKDHKGVPSTLVWPGQLGSLSATLIGPNSLISSLSTVNFVADSIYAHGLSAWKQVGTPTLACYPANNANTGNPAPFVGSPGVGSGWTGCLYSAPFTPVAFATYTLSAAVGFTGSGTMHVGIVDVSDYNAGNVTPATIYGNSPDASGRLIPNPTAGVYVSGGYGGSPAAYTWTASGSPPAKVCFAWWWSGASNAFSLAEPQIKGGNAFVGYTPGAQTTNTTDGTGTTPYGGTAKQVTSIIKDDGTGTGNGSIPKSTALNKQGSLLNVSGTPVFSYSATSTSISITIPASTYRLTDKSTVSVGSFTTSQSGLTAGTPYFWNLYYDIVGNTFGAAYYNTTAPTRDQILQDSYCDGRVPIYNSYSATPAVGGGGTAGGGGSPTGSQCPARWQEMLTLERGLIRADEIDIGMHLFHFETPVKVVEVTMIRAPIWRYTIERDGLRESFDVNDGHALRATTGEWVKVCEIEPGITIESDAKGPCRVADAEYLHDDFYVAIEVEGHLYTMGGALIHNPVTT